MIVSSKQWREPCGNTVTGINKTKRLQMMSGIYPEAFTFVFNKP
jgi:hypothetical protein